jgi:hypothetical protein
VNFKDMDRLGLTVTALAVSHGLLRSGLLGEGKLSWTTRQTLSHEVKNYILFSKITSWTDREPIKDRAGHIVPLRPQVEYRLRPFWVYDAHTGHYTPH